MCKVIKQDNCYVVKPNEDKSKPVIKDDISIILSRYNNKRFKFTNCVFKKPIKLQQITFDEILYFIDSTFEEEVDFSRSRFKERVFFSESTFHKKASFEEVIFDHNAYFDEVKFLGEADFRLSEFNETAHFYGTMFEKFPNFIQAIFEGNLNFEHVSLNFSYDSIRQATEYLYNQNNKKIEKLQIIENISHLIGNIKSSLLERHNILEASQYQKIELYCKELELEYKKEEEPQNSTTRDFIDKIQLYCYRVTSDHHTDLLLILNNVIILIACFGAMNFILNLICNRNYFDLSNSKVAIALGTLVACIIFIILALCLILGCYRNILHSFKLKMNNIQLFLSQIFFTTKQNTKICPRACIVLFSYIITTMTLVTKPTLLLPIFGQIIDSKSNLGFAFMSLNIVYAILMFLLIFSLQKTARKNTIVPS